MTLDVDRREVFRYLGYRGHEADEKTKMLVEACISELNLAAEPKVVSKELPLVTGEDGWIDGGCFQTKSMNLSKNLGGCGQVLLMAVTLGMGVDRLLMKYGKLQMSKAVVMQAAAAAMIEAYCNALCKAWAEEYEKKGLYLRPRYSPGYGDFSLSCQSMILDGLEAGKRVGITLTDGGLMVPTKSVTAVIGISEKKEPCHVEGCEACGNLDCAYRRSWQ